MTTTPNINGAQFIVVASTSRVSGKKEKIHAIIRKRTAIVSTVLDHLPRLQRAGGRGSPRQRLRRTQEIEMIYDDSRETVPSERMAWNATSEPMLMSDKMQTTMKLTQRAFRGTTNRLLTCPIIC